MSSELGSETTLDAAALTPAQTRVLFVFNALTGAAHLAQAIAILALSRSTPASLPVFIFRYGARVCVRDLVARVWHD